MLSDYITFVLVGEAGGDLSDHDTFPQTLITVHNLCQELHLWRTPWVPRNAWDLDSDSQSKLPIPRALLEPFQKLTPKRP